jgi:cytochrome c553
MKEMPMKWIRISATAFVLAPAAWGVQADDGRAARAVPLLPSYRAECSSCHIAYPPSLLPAASWERLMSTLPRHFGTDASLDAGTTAEIGRWLQAHAPRVAAALPADRITRSGWFVREHREVGSAVWVRPAVKSASNCAACHPRADQGVFDEHDIRIPR